MMHQELRSVHTFAMEMVTEKLNNAAIFFPRPLLLVTLEFEVYL